MYLKMALKSSHKTLSARRKSRFKTNAIKNEVMQDQEWEQEEEQGAAPSTRRSKSIRVRRKKKQYLELVQKITKNCSKVVHNKQKRRKYVETKKNII